MEKFLKKCWYMIGWSDELEHGRLLARRIANEPVVLHRDANGVAHALRDRCPHRFAPLHLGTIVDGKLQCAYHGLQFDMEGRCVHNPHGDGKIPPRSNVRHFPLIEKARSLWVWLGAAEEADPTLLPDLDALDSETHFVGRGYLHAKANYLLEADNIMDLGHIQYLHSGTLGSSGISGAEIAIEQKGRTIWSRRQTKAEDLPAFAAKALGLPLGLPVDRHLDVRWDPPASMMIFVSAKLSGQPDEQARGRMVANVFSPESDGTTHYWFAVSYEKSALGADGQAIATKATDDLSIPFLTEDLPMIEAVERSMNGEEFWSLRPLILPSDAGAVRARRVLAKLIRDEAAEEDLNKGTVVDSPSSCATSPTAGSLSGI